MTTRSFRYLLACALLFLGFSAGGRAVSEPLPKFTPKFTLGVSMHFMRDDYAVKLVESIEAVVAQYPGSKVVVTDANGTAQKQLADMENLVVQDVDAIIVVPIDEKAILPAIRTANQKNIPVVAVTRIPGAEVLTTIASNGDFANGRASGDLLVQATHGKGKVAMIGIPYSLWRIDERERGFEQAIVGTELSVVVRESGLDQAKVQDTVAGILVAHPDLAGIWCAFSNQLVGAADALRSANRKDIVLTGIDADKVIIERIRSGWITGAAAQFPRQQGKLAAEAVIAYLAGKPVAPAFEVPVGLVTADNADKMEALVWGD
jgi:ribose transport system substrate-binding protein